MHDYTFVSKMIIIFKLTFNLINEIVDMLFLHAPNVDLWSVVLFSENLWRRVGRTAALCRQERFTVPVVAKSKIYTPRWIAYH